MIDILKNKLEVLPSRLVIEGGQQVNGKVRVSGAKNAATRILAGSILTDEPVTLLNFPTHIADALHKMRFIQSLGVDIDVDHAAETVEVKAREITNEIVSSYDVPIRTTYLLTAGQIIRNGIARIPYPGGCKIGSRGYDLHIMVWEKLGCVVEEKNDFIEVRGHFKGAIIDFPISTVGGTENALLCTAVAEGHSEIRNAYISPEVQNLIEFLRRMGADIEVFGNSLVRVRGTGGLLHSARMAIMPDRIEALTWISLAVLTGGTLQIDEVPFKEMEIPLIHLQEAGIDLFRNSTSIFVRPDCLTSGSVQPFELACGTHPGVISDMQPFYVMLGLAAQGISRVYDYRYPQRVGYVAELQKFAPKAFEAEHGKITIHGITQLQAAEANSTDLRGSMAMIMAAILAKGTSTVNGVAMALRGYNDLLSKLQQVGVSVNAD